MFAAVVPGHAVQQAVQVPEAPERFVIQLEDALSVNHLCVFMTGVDGYATTIHLEMPGKGWQLIGSLSNAKPSAIFRLRGTFIPSANATSFKHPSLAAAAAPATTAHLGFSCEPVAAVEAQVAALGSTAAVANPASSSALVVSGSQASVDPLTLAQRVGKNLVSYVGGFAQAVTLPDGTTKYALDLSVVEKWYSNFERKLRTGGVTFLMQDE